MKKKIIFIPLTIVVTAFLIILVLDLVGPEFSRDEILIGGSTTVLHYSQMLADEYMKQNDGVRIICEGGGSTPGLIAVKNGSIDIASTSRHLTDDEDDECTNSYLIGKDSVGIIVNPSNPIDTLTLDQVKDIFSGSIDNWSDVGGTMSNIQVISRPSESTTLKGLKEIVMKGEKMAGSAVIASSAQELSVKVADNTCAIGFVALKDITNNVKVIKINGIEMNKSTILTERYPITRAFYYVIYDKPGLEAQNTESNIFDKAAGFFADDDANSLQAKREAIFRFLEFVKSPQGQKILEDNGSVAVY